MSAAGIGVRSARADDARRISALLAELGYPPPPPAVLDDVLADPDHVLLLAEEAGDVVGLLGADFRVHLHHGSVVATIDELVVDGRRRGAGVGARLVDAVLATARARGALRVEVSCHLQRDAAHRFYVRTGFERTSLKLVYPL